MASPSTTPAPSPSPSSPSSSPPDSSSSNFTQALSTISPLTDLQRLPTIPCARYALLFGIVAGTSVGALRFVFSRGGGGARGGRWDQVGRAANWAVGAWGVASLGAWETCRRRQTSESARMQALVSEVKARRAAKSSSSPKAPPGGVMLGEETIAQLRKRRAREVQLEQEGLGKEEASRRAREEVSVGPPTGAEAEPEGKKGGWWGGK